MRERGRRRGQRIKVQERMKRKEDNKCSEKWMRGRERKKRDKIPDTCTGLVGVIARDRKGWKGVSTEHQNVTVRLH